MYHSKKYLLPLRHTILVTQLISFAIAISPLRLSPLFSAISYCLAVFTSPILLLSYYCNYLKCTKKWLLEGIPCVAEAIFSILYIGAMIFGIRFYSNSILFSRLLTAYIADILLGMFWYLSYYVAVSVPDPKV